MRSIATVIHGKQDKFVGDAAIILRQNLNDNKAQLTESKCCLGVHLGLNLELLRSRPLSQDPDLNQNLELRS